MRFVTRVVAGTGLAALGAVGLTAMAPLTIDPQTVVVQEAPERRAQVRKVIVDGKDGDVEILGVGGSRLGVAIRDVEAADVTREKLPAPAGAVIEEVTAASAADKAGVKAGDVVVAFDGERVRSARQLERLVAETPAGRSVKVALQRAGARMELDVVPEASRMAFEGIGPIRWNMQEDIAREMARTLPRVERDFKRQLPAMEFDFDRPGGFAFVPGRGRLGVRVQDLSPGLAEYFGVKSGVLVAEVDADSPAARAGVKAGDVITAVNGQAVSDPDDLRREMGKADEAASAELDVTRDRKPVSLKVEVQPREKKSVERRLRRTI
jgi:serine protease Do